MNPGFNGCCTFVPLYTPRCCFAPRALVRQEQLAQRAYCMFNLGISRQAIVRFLPCSIHSMPPTPPHPCTSFTSTSFNAPPLAAPPPPLVFTYYVLQIVLNAIPRLFAPTKVDAGWPYIILAFSGVLVNLVGVLFFLADGSHGHDHLHAGGFLNAHNHGHDHGYVLCLSPSKEAGSSGGWGGGGGGHVPMITLQVMHHRTLI